MWLTGDWHGCRFEQDASVLDDLYLDRRGTAFNIGLYFIVNTQCNSVKCESISNVIAIRDAGKLHKACLCQSVFFWGDLQVLNVPGKTESFSWFCFLFRAINAVYRIHTWLATQTDWNLSRYPRGTASCHTVRSYTRAFITWFKVNLYCRYLQVNPRFETISLQRPGEGQVYAIKLSRF